jgi:hypothetical protein
MDGINWLGEALQKASIQARVIFLPSIFLPYLTLFFCICAGQAAWPVYLHDDANDVVSSKVVHIGSRVLPDSIWGSKKPIPQRLIKKLPAKSNLSHKF